MRFLRRRFAIVVLIVGCLFAVSVTGCSDAAKRAPVLVAQSGVALTGSIGQVSDAAAALQKASILPAAAALQLQEGLLAVNSALKPLPDILRTIDAAQKAGAAQQGDVEKAIAILQAVSPQISVLLAGVPVNETTKQIIALVRAAQATVTSVLLEVAKLRQPPSAMRFYGHTAAAA